MAQRFDQLRTRDVALAELDAQPEGLVVRAVVEDEWLRARTGVLLFLALAAGFVARQSGLRDAVDRFLHFAFVGLAGDLQEQRFRDDAAVYAHLAQLFRNHAQGHRFRHRGTRLGDLLGDIFVRVLKLLGEALQAVGFFKRGQVLALQVFDEREFQRFSVVGDFFDAGNFAQSRGARGVIAALAGNDVVAIVARQKAHQQRFQHALFLYGFGEFAQVAQEFPRLVGVGPDLIDRNHAADGRAAEIGDLFYVVRVMPHLQRDGQSHSLRHVG